MNHRTKDGNGEKELIVVKNLERIDKDGLDDSDLPACIGDVAAGAGA